MNTLLFTTASLLLISKFLDCLTTSLEIKSVMEEQNPLARKIMQKLGVQTTIWGIFILTIGVVSLSLWLTLVYFDTTFYKITFIIAGLLISVIQFAVAHTNKTKKYNFITKFILNSFNK